MKKLVKSFIVLIIVFAIVLTIGVLQSKKYYKQKKEVTGDLLITHCNIIDVVNGKTLYNKQVLIQNNKIVAIDSQNNQRPKNIKVIDAKGQYLMPGLRDMHIHTLSLSPQLHFPLLIANGVTGVRDMGDGDSWISDLSDHSERDKNIWEKQALTEQLLMPKIYEATSFHVEELKDIDSENFKQKIPEFIAALKKRGEPFVKVQLEKSNIQDYIFYELQLEAKKQKLSVLGHLPPNVDIKKVLKNDFKSIEHAWALIPHFIRNKKTFTSNIQQKKYDLAQQDNLMAAEVLQIMANCNTYYTPTHVTSNKKEYLVLEKNLNHNPNKIYVENVQFLLWRTLNWLDALGHNKKEDLPTLKKYYHRGLEITKLAQTNGVKLLAGSDALDRNVYYGSSLHDELKEMVKAGLSKAEALKTATLNPAMYYNIANEYGSIEVGKVADFILLKENPLKAIENTQSITAVYCNSRWYNSKDIAAMKSFVQKQANSFGISCKFIWNLIKRS